MTEKCQTSSMTSVTEEDTSSESDTTVSSYSNITSSMLSSTDDNTDDKLTPGLINIQISKSDANNKPCAHREPVEKRVSGRQPTCASGDGLFRFPYCANSFQHGSSNVDKQKKAKADKRLLKRALKQMKMINPRNVSHDNLGVDDPENKLSTDFSDTSSIPKKDNTNNNGDDKGDEDSDVEDGTDKDAHTSGSHQPFLPDMSSERWYQAQCFDHYWANYNFVMDWYRQHIHAVQYLSGQIGQTAEHPRKRTRTTSSAKSRKSRRLRRARNRRLSKERNRAACTGQTMNTDASISNSAMVESDSGEEMEMSITDDMKEFFTQSLKHRLERDSEKNIAGNGTKVTEMVNIEQAVAGHQGPSVSAPTERPGVRRRAEMKSLYGAGAPMIHGMETSLQMTFDRISDRRQPRLWPNMPLKIVFN